MGPSNTTGYFGVKVSQPGINVSQANANQLLYTNDYDTQTFYDASGNARVLLGTLPDGSYGLWVSAPDVNATTATPNVPGQLIFNSNQTGLGIVGTIITEIPEFNITASGGQLIGGTTLTIPHGQAFTPIVNVYVQGLFYDVQSETVISTSYIPLNISLANTFYLFPGGLADYAVSVVFGVDATNIYLEAYYNSSGVDSDTIQAIPATIFIQQNTAS